MSEFPQAGLDAGREALQRFLAGADDLATMHTKMVLVATEAIPSCDVASITVLRDDGTLGTPAYSHKAGLELDETQYAIGDGPCLSAMRHRGVEHTRIATDTRWPAFAAAAREHGVLATMSVPLGNGEAVVGSLNLYSQTAADYDATAEELACAFADQLGVAAARVTLYAEGYEVAHQLRQAMESRAVIEQAKGILMAAQRCGPDAAFQILVRASQNQNRKLRAIATEIVERYAAGEERPTARR